MTNSRIKAYIASGFFNPMQLQDVEHIKYACSSVGISYYSPKDELVANPNASSKARKEVFNANVDNIILSDVVIVNTRDKDIGSIFEAGFAFANKKPIIYYYNDPQSKGFNLMLAESGIAVCSSVDDLIYVLKMFIKDRSYKRSYRRNIE